MNQVELCLLDCSSIQRYVFGSNKLKSNIGASHVVQAIYDQFIPIALKKIYTDDVDGRYARWKTKPAVLDLPQSTDVQWETGFVGGGSALLLFRSGHGYAERFIKEWTTLLLLHAPGINPSVAILKDIPFENGDIAKNHIDDLYRTLQENKNKYLPQTYIDRHGITAECSLSGLSAETYDASTQSWISAVVKAKFANVEAANSRLEDEYAEALRLETGDGAVRYNLSEDTENLGTLKGDASQIAVVHIDGNSMGLAFKRCSGLMERRQLALEVDRCTRQAMHTTIQKLVQRMPALEQRNFFAWKDQSKPWLPLRPIIVNGDDITFITDARLAFYLAEVFVNAFSAETIEYRNSALDLVNQPVSCCAGIAIVAAKYPFYRAYQLAEQLCANAKRKGRSDNTSWLDFHIAYSSLTGDLDVMRQKQYLVGQDYLLWRPWKISKTAEKSSYSQAKTALKLFSDAETWPKSRLHDLGHALSQGKAATKRYIEQLIWRGLTLPKIAQLDQVQSTGWFDNKTPYFDILEMAAFYPDFLLDGDE